MWKSSDSNKSIHSILIVIFLHGATTEPLNEYTLKKDGDEFVGTPGENVR